MNTKKILYGGITGGVAFFFLGWLIYGILLNYEANQNQCAARPMDQFIWPALILSNLAGICFSHRFCGRILLDGSVGQKGALFGFLTSFSIDLVFIP
jgi:hypothetical protein